MRPMIVVLVFCGSLQVVSAQQPADLRTSDSSARSMTTSSDALVGVLWTDATDPLNRPVHGIQAGPASPNALLIALRDFIYTNRFAVSRGTAGSISLRVDSGTVMNALDRLTLASDHTMWTARYRGADPHGNAGWGLKLDLRDAEHVTALAATRQPPLLGQR